MKHEFNYMEEISCGALIGVSFYLLNYSNNIPLFIGLLIPTIYFNYKLYKK